MGKIAFAASVACFAAALMAGEGLARGGGGGGHGGGGHASGGSAGSAHFSGAGHSGAGYYGGHYGGHFYGGHSLGGLYLGGPFYGSYSDPYYDDYYDGAPSYYSAPSYYYDASSGYGPSYPDTTPAVAPTGHLSIEVQVPTPDAQVWINNQPSTQPGQTRWFDVNQIYPDQPYRYEVRATWMMDGRPVTQTRLVTARAGETAQVLFGKDAR